MGDTGRYALTIIGTVVGAYFGNPQLGFVIGSALGSALFPPQLPTVRAPRLADVGQTKATVGAPIPRGWGTFPVDGVIIHQSDIREFLETTEVGGKGGPSQKVEKTLYYQDFAILLHDGEIGGIRRIWANGKIIYDKSVQRADESTAQFQSRLALTAATEETMVVYLGTEDQMPDSTLEAIHGGPGSVSAHRGYAYVVFVNWRNKDEDGQRMPAQWRFELYSSGAESDEDGTVWSNEVLYPWGTGGDPLSPLNDHHYVVHGTGLNTRVYDSLGHDNLVDALTEGGNFQGVGSAGLKYMGHGLIGGLGSTPLATSAQGGSSAAGTNALQICLHYNKQDAARFISYATVESVMGVGANTCETYGFLFEISNTQTPVHTNSGQFVSSDSYHSVQMPIPGGGGIPDGWDFGWDDCYDFSGSPFTFITSWDVEIFARRVPRAPDDPCEPRGGPDIPRVPGNANFGYANGQMVRCGNWTLVTGGSFKVMQTYGEGPIRYPRNPALPAGHSSDNSGFWTQAYNEAVAVGKMPAGLTYGVHYPVTQSFAYRLVLEGSSVTPDSVPISEILHDVLVECGYLETEFDVTDLDDTFIIGYVRPTPCPGRGVVEALRMVGMFDLVEVQGVLTAVRRGKAIVDTISEELLGARYASEPRAARTTTVMAQEKELPYAVRFHYLSYERDYDPGEAQARLHPDTTSSAVMDIECTAVLEDDHAQRIVQSVQDDAWKSRFSSKISLPQESQKYVPSDSLAVPVDGEVQRFRVVNINDRFPIVRDFDLVQDDDGSYVAYAVPSPPASPSPTIALTSPALPAYLNLPALTPEGDDAGFYLAGHPALNDSWRGASLRRSSDEGVTYQPYGTIGSTESPMGELELDLAAGPSDVLDESSVLTVRMTNGMLASCTFDELLSGANVAAVGAEGRWEVLQFMTVTQVGTGTLYQLSGLARGRRGTEHNIGLGVTGDQFVLLSSGGLSRAVGAVTDVGEEFLFKLVGLGLSEADATAEAFTSSGEALRPLSPAAVEMSRSADGSWVATWIRRDRLADGYYPDGVAVPMSEVAEDYEVDVIAPSGAVIRTISVSTPRAVWTLADQTTDLGIGQATWNAKVYQLSADVGRGRSLQQSAAVALSGAALHLYIERGYLYYTSAPTSPNRCGALYPDSGSYIYVLDLGNGNVVARRHPTLTRLINTADSLSSVGITGSGFYERSLLLGGITFIITRDNVTGRTKLSRVDSAVATVTHTITSGGVSLDYVGLYTTNGTNLFVPLFNNDLLELNPATLATLATTGYVGPHAEEAPPPGVTYHDLDILEQGTWVYVAYALQDDNRVFVRRYSTTTGLRDGGFSAYDVGRNSFGQRAPYLSYYGGFLGIGLQQPSTVVDVTTPTLYREY